jgi:type I site-specific restriction endonuclease
VHRNELLKQTLEKAQLCGFLESEISVISADNKQESNKLMIAMVQTLARNLQKYSVDDVQLMIVDEAHHATANSYRTIFNHFDIYNGEKYLFGFTATPLRGDKEHLSDIFHTHSFKMTLSEATQQGYIVPVHGIRIQIDKSLKEIDTQQGDYDISQLDKVMNCDSVNNIIVERCLHLKKTPSIIFCTSVDHAENLSKLLREKKRKAISVSYKTPKKTLERIFKMLDAGRIEFITNAVKLSEGFDHPPISSIVLARPTRSPVLYKQMIGRGLRNHPGKFDCLVIEFCSNDPSMIVWDDIDENCTFQSSSNEKKKTREEALKKYKSIFLGNQNIQILDVRISPFEFYECKIQRIVKYKNFYFVPFTEGFTFYELKKPKNKIDRSYGHLFNLFASMFFWEYEFKSFYAWGEKDWCMTEKESQPIERILPGIKHYSNLNKLGKWYASENEPLTRQQKILLKSLNIKF